MNQPKSMDIKINPETVSALYGEQCRQRTQELVMAQAQASELAKQLHAANKEKEAQAKKIRETEAALEELKMTSNKATENSGRKIADLEKNVNDLESKLLKSQGQVDELSEKLQAAEKKIKAQKANKK